jgi:hypothetical protein
MGTIWRVLDVGVGVRRHCLVAVVVLVVSVFSACEDQKAADEGRKQQAAASERVATNSVDWSSGEWVVMPSPPAGISAEEPPVWTGEEFVIWGTPGAAFRPADRTWRSLPPAPIRDRVGEVAVWTGAEVVYWGGVSPDRRYSRTAYFADGAAYNPSSNAWRLLPPSPLPARSGAVANMVGGTVVLWGGNPPCDCGGDSVIHDPGAARYDPVTNSWSRLGDVPEPWSGDDGGALWLTVRGSSYVFRRQRLGQYVPAADLWRELPSPPDIPPPLCQIGGTGSAVAIAGAWDQSIFTWSGGCQPEYGLAFDTVTGQWRHIATAPTHSTLGSRSTIGNGTVFLETWPETAARCGLGPGCGEGSASVHAYVIADDRWVDLPAPPAGTFGIGAHLTWTGSELIAWGGFRGSDLVLAGALYRAR